MKLTGAQILVRTLIEQGVDLVFGYPGGAALNVYDALYEARDEIRHVLSCHEQGAAHAADGYARVSGRTGVVFATSGPGASNLVTGIATAHMDSVPMLAITSNVSSNLIGKDSFQELDIVGITLPVTKHNFIVKDAEKLADTVRRALVIARSGRPGPVLIDIPKDVTGQLADYEPKARQETRPAPCLRAEELEEAVRLIAAAEKPLIFAGGGVVSSGASPQLEALAERMDAPVCLSMPGITALPWNHPRNLGMVGMHGTPASNRAVVECDLLLCVGTRFSDRVTGGRKHYAPKAKKIQIDIDGAENGKNLIPDLFLEADAKDALGALAARIEQKKHDVWMHRLIRYKALNPLPDPPGGNRVNTRDVLKAISNLAGENATLVTDVGQHQMITVQYYRFLKPRTFISSCGLGTMGYGMGAAVGAKLAAKDRPVVLITSDGSFHMNMSELATAVTEALPLVVLIMNNGVLGMVRQWQKLFYGSRFSATTPNRKTDFVKLAEAFGARGFLLEQKTDIAAVLQEALSSGGPCVVDCRIDRDDNVFPIIPPGKGEEDMIFFDQEIRHERLHFIASCGKLFWGADARHQPVRAARLQHQSPDGGRNGGPGRLADHHRHRGRRADGLPDHKTAAEA